MKINLKIKLALALVIILSLSIGTVTFLSLQSKKTDRIFYVDSANGNDKNSGRSEDNAWKTISKVNSYKTFGPGDKILFKAGSSFNGPLKLVYKGSEAPETNCISGTEEKPIVLNMYGDGNKPLIEGSGDDKDFGAVCIKNLQYIEVENLQITNKGDYSRRGIYVTAIAEDFPNTTQTNPMKLNHIYIKNCEIKEVDSMVMGMSSPSKCYGGIIFKITSERDGENWVTFNDILVSNNYIHNLSRCGMYTHSDFNTDLPYTQGGGEGTRPRLPWTKVVVKNNYVADVAGDGLVLTTCNSPLLENNVVARPQRFTNSDLYAVGMWPFGCYDAVLQYNECFGNQTKNDGMGFDLDFGCKRSILQYNYSHDNEGGFVLVCSGPGQNEQPTVRYNISQNDGCSTNSRIFLISGSGTKDCRIYNNTVYTATDPGLKMLESRGVWMGTPESITFTNNIYINRSTEPWSMDTHEQSQVKMDHNSFFGITPAIDATNNITLDPMLVKPGSGTTGMAVNLGKSRGNVDGYKLQPNSPCINAGLIIEDNGGQDYWGNKLYSGAPDIGAFEYTVP